MTYVNNFIRIDVIGDCYNKKEIWNTGLKIGFAGPGAISEEHLIKAAEGVASAWEEFFFSKSSGIGKLFSESYRTKEVKASHVGEDGKVIGNTYTHFYDRALVGGNTTRNPLPQAAVVASMRSSKQRGPGSQGRMYLPGICYITEDNGLMPQPYANAISYNFNAFVNKVNSIGPALVKKYEVILTSPVGEGVELPVTKTGVDQKVDTQRRRANSLTSDYVTHEVL